MVSNLVKKKHKSGPENWDHFSAPEFGPPYKNYIRVPPFWGAFFAPTFENPRFVFWEAAAVWKWWHATRVRADGKPLLLINMDETSVSTFYGYTYGNIATHRTDQQEPIQWANRAKQRTCMTHACFICDNARLQKRLPQLILVNMRTCNQTVGNVYVGNFLRGPAEHFPRCSLGDLRPL